MALKYIQESWWFRNRYWQRHLELPGAFCFYLFITTMNKIFILLAVILLSACSTGNKTSNNQPADATIEQSTSSSFMESISDYCGNSYRGTVVFPSDGTDPFEGQELVMHVQTCADSVVMIPFTVGEDKSRTWMIRKTAEGLQLKHDHRHKDGTPDEVTMYGGISISPEASLKQQFPADAHTAQLIPAASTNEWTLEISPDDKTFSYILKRDNKMRFQADFDLTNPI